MNKIKNAILKLTKIDLVRIFSLNALATTIRMLTGMISVKVVAIIIGPSGIALLGQLSNFNNILLGLANGGISTGITKYVAEYKDNDHLLKCYLSNALKITLFCSVIIGLLLISFCKILSEVILLTPDYYYIFIIFGITIILYTLNGLVVAILNGLKLHKKYIIVNISGTILGLLYSVLLVTIFGLPGALINAVTFQSIVFLITLWICRKELWLSYSFFCQKFDQLIVQKFLGYSLMTITTLALLPVSQIILRGYVMSEISIADAGLWEGMNRISGMYLTIFTTAFSVYYLPRLSEIKNQSEMRSEIFKCFKLVAPLLIIIGVSIYLLRYFILWFLFTPDFYPMEELFGWQMAGDFFKVSSWMLAYVMVAKAKTKTFIFTEIAFTFSYLAVCFILLRVNGVVGLVQGYMINYILYLLLMIFLFKNILNKRYGTTKDDTIAEDF